MIKNMNTLDRVLRALVVAPLLVIAALFVGAGTILGVVLLVLAAVMLATAAVGFCPLYALFHLNTRGQQPLPH
jgi:Inner membrane protein YgaP-like, transmembrane domain